MAANFAIVSDDQYRAFVNVELVCFFRYKKGDDGEIAVPEEVEIEFIGGSKTKLHGQTAKHFITAMSKALNRNI
jgi:hypothetical protein